MYFTFKKLKPVIEKKRRDRINHNLDALRDLLFKNTADSVSRLPRFNAVNDQLLHFISLTKP